MFTKPNLCFKTRIEKSEVGMKKGILYEHDWGWVEWCARKNTSMMACTSITIIYRLHADLLTCVHVDEYVISNTDMYCFLYLCVISHVFYMNIPIQ